MKRTYLAMALLVVVGGMLSATDTLAQKREHIEATMQGTSTQLGRMVSINIIVNEYSTADDQKVLVDAFQQKRSQGLVNALHKMHSKGRISIPGTLGYDINYIREFKLPDGRRKIRFVTDRPITFGEAWTSSRSQDYSLSLGEIILGPDTDKSEGTIVPAARFKIDKEKELTIEAFRNPWKLVNIRIRD